MELVKIEIDKKDFETLIDSGVLDSIPHTIIEVKVNDNFFDNDLIYKNLQKKSLKAYKEFQEYQFKKRHNIK
jgi:dihydrofolate reductase